MAIFTSILNLLKKNPVTDGADTFNIQTMMNDNWDKIDAAIGMVGVRAEVRAATTGNIPLSGLTTIDGVTLSSGDRVLVKNQTVGSENGVYTAASGSWVRASDADRSGKISAGIAVYVAEGDANAGTGWVMTNSGPITLGTTALAFAQKTGPGAATDEVIGKRTIDDSVKVGSTDTDTATNLLSKLGAQLRKVTGEADWYTPPATSLAALEDEVLSSAAPNTLTLKPGVNVYNASRESRLNSIKMSGRTLVNLLGRDGNCENLGQWSNLNASYPGSIAVDTADKVAGLSCMRLTVANNNGRVTYAVPLNIKYGMGAPKYLIVGYIRNGTFSGSGNGAYLGISDNLAYSVTTTTVLDTSRFGFVYAVYDAAQAAASGYACMNAKGSNGQYAYFDGIAVYELSPSQANEIATMTAAQIAAKYPYVDDVKHVNAIYASNPGKNLLPPLVGNLIQNRPNSVVVEPYKYVLTPATTDEFDGIEVPCNAGTTYTLSIVHNGQILLRFRDKSGATLLDVGGGYSSAQTLTGTAPANSTSMVVFFRNSAATGTYSFERIMLNIGPTPLSFEPQRPSYMYLPDANLRSNVDGSVADQLYTDGQGRPRVVRRFREVELDGSLAWGFGDPYTGFKRVAVLALLSSNYAAGSGKISVVKYDGKPLSIGPTNVTADAASDGGSTALYVAIANADSGWGDRYSPSVDEIKAYFYGWKMTIAGDATGVTNFNGSGTKAWVSLASWNGTSYFMAGAVSAVPSVIAEAKYSPYRLMYQLAQSVDEPISYEGDLMFHEGANQIDVGTGVVVREATTPLGIVYNAFHINTNVNGVPQKLKRRGDRILEIFKNGISDKAWTKHQRDMGNVSIPEYGRASATVDQNSYDPAAAYSVTYLALDTHALGIAPVAIDGEYAVNIKETVDTLTHDMTDIRATLSVLQTTKAAKQQPQWIVPTLFNGWAPYSGYAVSGYYKDDMGVVHLSGFISSGGGGLILILPPGYRPVNSLVFATASYDGTSVVACSINLLSNGSLMTGINCKNTWLCLDGISFKAI